MSKAKFEKFNFTKTALLKLPTLDKQTYYWDTTFSDLGLGVSPRGKKVFVLHQRINDQSVRLKLGSFPETTIEQARKLALDKAYEVKQGYDPRLVKQAKKDRQISLKQVYKDYYAAKPNLSQGTIDNYNRSLTYSFADWAEKPIGNITENMIKRRYSKDGLKSPARASQSMRALRAIFNFARKNYKDAKHKSLFPHNPVEILAELNSWYDIPVRKTYIKDSQLAEVFKALLALKKSMPYPANGPDYLIMCLFTGLRKSEIASLHIDQIDLRERSMLLKGADVKNKCDHHVPLNSVTFPIIQERVKQTIRRESEISVDKKTNKELPRYLFPADTASGHFEEPKYICEKVRELSGVKVTSHDYRRTFITVAESLDISLYTWKRLVNHKIPKTDVSGGYVVPNIKRLRKASQMVCDEIVDKLNNNTKAEEDYIVDDFCFENAIS